MSLANVINLVTARASAVASAKNVYNYARQAKEAAVFNALFLDPIGKHIHAWMITREATEKRDEGEGTTRHIHSIVLMGYYSVIDSANSEGAFQQVIEDMCLAFDPLSLRQYGGQVDWSQPVQVQGPTTLMFGNVFVHAAKLTHKVEEVIF